MKNEYTVVDLCPSIDGHKTLTRIELRWLLLQTGGETFRDGKKVTIKHKHLGVGVHRVWLEIVKREVEAP
jgi:hypothetical protein